MPRKEIEKALSLATETKFLKIERDILSEVPAIFKEQFPGRKGIIIADNNTYEVAGKAIYKYLIQAGLAHSEPFVLTDADLYADYRFVKRIVVYLKQHNAIAIAVGSGVINDLTKRANYELERPYMCIATAASMDGYTAYGASITKDGAKITMRCPAPQVVVADLAIISEAPHVTTASGYADLYAKIPAGADWIFADALGEEALDTQSWNIVQDGLFSALGDPEGARKGELTAIEPLIEGLMLGGFAIQSLCSSRPASGAEHQFSHLWDMEHHVFDGPMAKRFGLYPNQDEQAPSHGFKVGIGTLAITALYERIIATSLDQLDIKKAVDQWKSPDEQILEVRELFKGTDIEEFATKQVIDKYISEECLEKQLNTLKNNWTKIREDLKQQIIPYEETKRRLKLVGAPVECEEIGISRERLKNSFIKAQKIRSRFTILDVAVRTGYLDAWIEELFGDTGVLKKHV